MNTTTFTGAPRADRFRLGDTWIGPNGRPYRVRRSRVVGPGLADLVPIGPDGPCIRIRQFSVRGYRRISWGGEA